ncbi:MAG: penicillin-binding transpeptidase domain-containing protein [Actinobacteria bacterium]|nr:penicillin-binding transpeptidase domain-containing protein [Actinomycetota bacterium]
MTRQINRVTLILILLMLALIANLSYIQFFNSAELRHRPGNQRVLLAEYSKQRGPILISSDPIAQSKTTNDALKYLRTYANGPTYAAATGFYSLVYGATGIEQQENDVLSGSDNRFFVDRLQQLFANRQPQGGAVELTINPRAQKAAMEALNGRTGAVVALDPSTGAILALASSPGFDPNRLASHDTTDMQNYWQYLNENPKQPLLNRPLAMTLPPGSTFKLVTAAAALESGNYRADSTLPGPATIGLPNSSHRLGNWTHNSCGYNGKTTLDNALSISCNTAFAWLGMKLGEDAISEQAKKFGFGNSFSVPMNAATSQFPTGMDKAQTAMSAIGQFDVQATALQMALVGAGIGNDGVVMRPFLVSQVLGPNLKVLENATPQQFSRAMSTANARTLGQMMTHVVDRGTGSNARIYGVAVGGKTGTAETSPGSPAHAWFVGIAPAVKARVSVAVVLQDGGGATEISGNGLAAPIARAVIQAVLNK